MLKIPSGLIKREHTPEKDYSCTKDLMDAVIKYMVEKRNFFLMYIFY